MIKSVLKRLKQAGFGDHCLEGWEPGKFYFRYDFPDSNPDDAWDTCVDVMDSLHEVGLELNDYLLEHDCISGDLVDLEREQLQECIARIEEEK